MVLAVFIPFDDSKPLENYVLQTTGTEGVTPSIQTALQGDVLETPLLRPSIREVNNTTIAGLYAYHNSFSSRDGTVNRTQNIRATRLSMSCGLLSLRFHGNVVLVRSFGYLNRGFEDLGLESIRGVCCISPDLRCSIQNFGGTCTSEVAPSWLTNAACENYHDAGVLARVALAMTEHHESEDSDSSSDSAKLYDSDDEETTPTQHTFVTRSSLCLQCRRLTDSICPGCEGCYVCDDCCTSGRRWSHECQCQTWKMYVSHREELSSFDFGTDGDGGDWYTSLMGRGFQTSEEPYEQFIKTRFGTLGTGSWWRTELSGWAGGNSDSASAVDPTVRQSYRQGFAPLCNNHLNLLPPERHITSQDVIRVNLTTTHHEFIQMPILNSWAEYYALRGISPSSPVALLCTFPLTIYYALQQYGSVPATVAQMGKRALRIHVVGAEKELNFLDLFKEIGFLLPNDGGKSFPAVELVFIVREDMLPTKISNDTHTNTTPFCLTEPFLANLTVKVVSGTYGDETLDPNFDIGSGPPDMIMALNAGLFAYESWRFVVSYLHQHPTIVGVFSDYNEYSGMNCAALGGCKARESLRINPFRQPRAMPVYSMNLPQFSNGFLYVFNEQELE